MNIKSWFAHTPSPRVMLIFPAIVTMLFSMWAGALALSYNSLPFTIVGLVLGAAWLAMLVLMAMPQTDRWLGGTKKWFKPLAASLMALLVFCGAVELLALVATGLGTTTGGILGASTPKFLAYISHDLSSGDTDALLNQAKQNLIAGVNPYAEANVVSAMIADGGVYDKTTPLRTGQFAAVFPYPSSAAINALWIQAVQTPQVVPSELESSMGYPAGYFVIPALFSLAGINNLHWVFLILVVAGLGVAVWLTPARFRIWLAGAALGSLVIWNGVASGLTGSLYFPFLLLGFMLWKRNLWVSAILMGIAIATKQTVWFFLPFYIILLARQLSWKKAAIGAGLVAAVFVLFNLPFIVGGPQLWLDSVLSPMRDALFPSGWGAVTAVLQGWLPIKSSMPFTIAEALVFAGSIIWYWRYARRYPWMAAVLPLFALFFAWRSLWPYFFYADIILLALVMQEYSEHDHQPVEPALLPAS
jgi:hypothetical protein